MYRVQGLGLGLPSKIEQRNRVVRVEVLGFVLWSKEVGKGRLKFTRWNNESGFGGYQVMWD